MSSILSLSWLRSRAPKLAQSCYSLVSFQPNFNLIFVQKLSGTTRDNFDGKPVTHLEYTSYPPRALRTMLSIARSVKEKYSLTAISMIHRLGIVPIGEESILIALSAPHRGAAWRGGEEALEECKDKVEVWKLEEFGGEEGGVWRANRDGVTGVRMADSNEAEIQDE